MKKTIVFALVLLLAISLVACGGNDTATNTPETEQSGNGGGDTSTPDDRKVYS